MPRADAGPVSLGRETPPLSDGRHGWVVVMVLVMVVYVVVVAGVVVALDRLRGAQKVVRKRRALALHQGHG